MSSRSLNIIYAISFLDLFAVGLTFPLFGNHIKELGASHFTIGLVSSLYAGLQILSGPIAGSWSDVRDRRSVLIVSLIICSLAYLGLGFTHSIPVIVLIRVVLGIAKHTQSICKAIITDLLPISERAGAFGRSASYGSIGFIAGPLLGGHLSEIDNGFFYVSVCTGFLFCINIFLCYWLPPPSKVIKKRKRQQIILISEIKHEFKKSVSDLVNIDWSKFWQSFLLRFLFGLSLSTFFSQQSFYLQDQFNLSKKHVCYTISFYSTIGAFCGFTIHYITNHFYKNDENCLQRLRHFFFMLSTSTVLLYFAPNIQIYWMLLIPFSLGATVLRIVSMELMLKQAYMDHRGSLSGASNSIMSIARFLTPAITGLISDQFGGKYTMVFGALPPLIGFVVASNFKLDVKQNKHKTT